MCSEEKVGRGSLMSTGAHMMKTLLRSQDGPTWALFTAKRKMVRATWMVDGWREIL
jgi:hypothetical protein